MLAGLAVLLFAGSAYATTGRNLVWQDNVTLFQDTVRKSPDFPPARNELGMALREKGRSEDGDSVFIANSIGAGIRNREYVDLNKAAVMIGKGDQKGAKQLLLASLNPDSNVYSSILAKLVTTDQCLLDASVSGREKTQLRGEIIGLLEKLHGISGDPFYYYKLGQQHLAAGDKAKARAFFSKAASSAAEGADYKVAAGKLAERLKP